LAASIFPLREYITIGSGDVSISVLYLRNTFSNADNEKTTTKKSPSVMNASQRKMRGVENSFPDTEFAVYIANALAIEIDTPLLFPANQVTIEIGIK
jgi:hypothetical protein